MTVIRLGLVGLGKIARDQHLPAIAQMPGIELVAIASRNASAPGVANHGTIEAMLAEGRLDAVVLCQPPQARYAAARAALLAGCHVFLEKPPGATLSEVEALASLAEARRLTVFASWHSRAAASVDAARDWLASADITAVHIDWKEDATVWHPGQTWLWEPGGFGVFDPGINALSILTAIMPEPVRMLAADLDLPANCAAPIAARLAMATASGVPISATFDFRQSGPPSWDIIVDTTRGRLVLAEGGNRLHLPEGLQPAGQEQEYPRLYARFVDLVRAGASDVDVTPLRLVADAFLIARHNAVAAFAG
jgi:predicted dehydrogenase